MKNQILGLSLVLAGSFSPLQSSATTCTVNNTIQHYAAVLAGIDESTIDCVLQRKEINIIRGTNNDKITQFAMWHSFPGLSITEKNIVIETQRRILDDLIQGGYDSIFLEGRSLAMLEADMVFIKKNKERIRSIFADSKKKGLQDQLLYTHTAGLIYAIIQDNVELLVTEGAFLELAWGRGMDPNTQTHDVDYKNFESIVFHAREMDSVSRVKKFYNKNPGSKIAIMYGRSHDFESEFLEYFDGEKRPNINIIQYPDLDWRMIASSKRSNGLYSRTSLTFGEKRLINSGFFQEKNITKYEYPLYIKSLNTFNEIEKKYRISYTEVRIKNVEIARFIDLYEKIIGLTNHDK